jgi:tRNA(Ile)-lysidine synthase
MLLGLHELAGRAIPSGRLLVAHARHDLRPEAAGDADFVTRLAERLRIPCVVRSLEVREPDGIRGEGLEARARRLRLAFLADVAHGHGARCVALAHTADDQAETILHRGLRGTGLAGLGGMAAARELCDGVAIVRPLLAVPRSVAREYLAACGQTWCEDATNADVRHARNFLRHEILPRCEAGPYPAATASLVRLGQQAALVAGAVRSAAEHLLEAHAQRHADGAIVIQARRLAALDRHLVAEIFVALWRREGWALRDMTARHYATLARMALAAGDPSAAVPSAVDLPGGVRARTDANGMLVVERSGGR